MIGFNTGHVNKAGTGFNSGNGNYTGMKKITGIEFKAGYGYVSDKRNKTG
jgi:hypothetical protein